MVAWRVRTSADGIGGCSWIAGEKSTREVARGKSVGVPAGGLGGGRLGAGEDEEVIEAELKFFVADEAEVGCGKNLHGLGDIVAVMFF